MWSFHVGSSGFPSPFRNMHMIRTLSWNGNCWYCLYIFINKIRKLFLFYYLFFSWISSYAHSLFTAVCQLSSLSSNSTDSLFLSFQTQWSGSCNHLIVTKQSLYGRNVNCEIFSDEKKSEQASWSVAQNFKLLSELTDFCSELMCHNSRSVYSMCCSVWLCDLLKSFSDRRVYKQLRDEPTEQR